MTNPHPWSPLSLRLACALSAALLLACSQDEGDTCQEDRDCADGLICSIADSERGTCIDPDDRNPPRDGGAEVDGSEPELPDDLDAGATDEEDAGR